MRPQHSRKDQGSHFQIGSTAQFCVALALLALSSCSSKKGEVATNHEVATTLSISAYSQARMRASAGAELQYSFPMLEIYNGSGVLVYQSREAMANARILKQFPGVLQNQQPQEHAPRLANIIEQIPDFKAVEQKIGSKKKWVLLSVDLQDCEGCGVQEDALRRIKRHLLEQESVDILEIHVLRP
jgi:hypothetical protein